MKIAIVTSIKAPYRTLQFKEISKNKDFEISVYYTKKGDEGRKWQSINSNSFREEYLENISIFDKLGTLNKGLNKIIKNNDVIFLGGYEKPTYIILSILCRLYKKKYIIIYDGISCNKLYKKENKIKKFIKGFVINSSSAIWGNGTVSRKYFSEVFNYPGNKIYNQYLTIDGEMIKKIGKEKKIIREELRKKYGISNYDKVLHYSGRVIKLKNIESIIKALNKIKDENIILLITGGGEEEKNIKKLAKNLNVNVIITGFIEDQYELFKHYYLSDVFILPSISEAWGLVVNEAMFAGLPILVSEICGCSLDFIDGNGYLINPFNIDDISFKIKKIFKDDLSILGEKSICIINEYNFENSSKSFTNIIKNIELRK